MRPAQTGAETIKSRTPFVLAFRESVDGLWVVTTVVRSDWKPPSTAKLKPYDWPTLPKDKRVGVIEVLSPVDGSLTARAVRSNAALKFLNDTLAAELVENEIGETEIHVFRVRLVRR